MYYAIQVYLIFFQILNLNIHSAYFHIFVALSLCYFFSRKMKEQMPKSWKHMFVYLLPVLKAIDIGIKRIWNYIFLCHNDL